MEEELEQEEKEAAGRWSLARLLGLAIVVVVVVAALYLLVGYVAWQSGQIAREQQVQQQRTDVISRQLTLAREDMSGESFNLALQRLEWILERDPQNRDALAIRSQAEAALKTSLTPVASPTPTTIPEPTPTPGVIGEPEEELRRLQRLEENEQWSDLITSVLVYQHQYPSHQRLETDRLLYDAYLKLGLREIQGDQAEMGIYYFSQAEKLGDLPQEALDYWLWAELYLQGLAYYGVDWRIAIGQFRDLCIAAPFYQGACDKLYESLFSYGDQYAALEDWCPAIDLYREAAQYQTGSALNQKIATAREQCSLATPTPPTITDTLPVTSTLPIVPAEPDE